MSSRSSGSRSRSNSPAPKEMASQSDNFWAKQASAWVNNKTSEQGPTALMALIATQAAVQMASQAEGNRNALPGAAPVGPLPDHAKGGNPPLPKILTLGPGGPPPPPLGPPMGPQGGFNVGPPGHPMPPANFQTPAGPPPSSFLAGLTGYMQPGGMGSGGPSPLPMTTPVNPPKPTPAAIPSAPPAATSGTAAFYRREGISAGDPAACFALSVEVDLQLWALQCLMTLMKGLFLCWFLWLLFTAVLPQAGADSGAPRHGKAIPQWLRDVVREAGNKNNTKDKKDRDDGEDGEIEGRLGSSCS